ncbi:hypothetical protein SAMN05421827_10345 [Pedobacter terrae]|uniref:Uncharacterized protein n=1 Tax=Pedobacter terrae TaxID=405671 RepID=A0A1G7R4U4_9SPHI|nr:hypothetical protein [Pedobacter terrae]SDG04980.1 hypothetical protein SAMN05421827_10345 [Pedobacter terrae]
MKLKGAEKQFWWHFGHITEAKNIPTKLSGFTSIDSGVDDEYIAMLLAKVSVIGSIYLKETEVTDEGVKLISNVKQLKYLTLMKHENITKACLPYLNKLTDLEYLDIWRTKIRLEDIVVLKDLKNLKELHISSHDEGVEESRDAILEKIIKAEEVLPNCIIHT